MKMIRLLVILCVSMTMHSTHAQNSFQPYNTQGDNLIHVTTADFDGIGTNDYVVGMSIEGKVIAFQRPDLIVDPTSSTNRLWEYQTPNSFNIMIIAADAITSSPGDEILVPGTDGHLRILSKTGVLLADWPVSSGVLYSADVGVNNAGQKRIVTGGVDGKIYILNESGTQLAAIMPYAAGNGHAGVIRRVVVGNYDGLGGDEVISFYDRNSFSGNNFFEVTDLNTLARPSYWGGVTSVNVNDVQESLGWTDKQLPHAYDMDGDGDDELVGHWGVLHPENGPGTQVLSTMLTSGESLDLNTHYIGEYEDTDTGKYLLQQGVPGNFRSWAAYPGPEMVTIYGDDLYLVDYDTVNEPASNRFRVKDYGYAHTLYHFTDGARLEDRNGGVDKLVLAGPPNGDDHFYVVDFNSSQWKTDAKTINGNGVLGEISDTLDALELNANNFNGTTAVAGKPIWYVDNFDSSIKFFDKTNPTTLSNRADEVKAAIDTLSGDLFGGGYDPQRVYLTASLGPAGNGEDVTVVATNGLENFATALAVRGVHFCLIIGKGGNKYIEPDHLADIFESSIVGTNSYMMTRTKELSHPADIDTYKPHMDALIARATTLGVAPPKVMFCTKGPIFSIMTPAQVATYFPAYKDVFVPGVENSNVNELDWSFAERAGLWLNGDVESWGCNTIGDNLAANRVVEYGGMRNGHMTLRHMLSQYALGADVFRVTSVQGKDNPLFLRDATGPKYSSAYGQGIYNFLRLVEKGIYPNGPDRSQLKGVSPVAAALYQPVARLHNMTDNHNFKDYTVPPQDYVINKLSCWDAYSDVPDVDLTAIMLNTKRRWENFLPTSPSGFVPVVPYVTRAQLEANTWCNRAYQTDGNSWAEFGSLTAGRDAIAAELVAQKFNQLFYVDNECFWQVTQQKNDTNTLFAVLMDSNTLSPTNRTVQLKKGSATGIWQVFDQFGSQSIPLGGLTNGSDLVSISIPAGAARFLTLKTDFTPGGGGSTTNLYNAAADTYSKQNSPTVNYGGDLVMQVRSNNTKEKNSYMKFSVTGVSGTIDSAKLRVHIGANPIQNLTLHHVVNTSWDEYTLNWNNAPAIGGSLGTKNNILANTWYEWDVTAAITANGLYSFALKSTSNDTFRDIDTRESAFPPVLEIVYSTPPPNQPPAFTSDPINEINATEDAAYSSTIGDNASDPETDSMTFSKLGGPPWLSVAANGALSGTPANSDVGLNVFTVQVTATGGSDTATLNITVDNVNDAPVFTTDPMNKPDANEGEAYSDTIAGSATDVDAGDALTYSKIGGPAWLNVAANGALSGTPANTNVGLNVFTVKVEDLALASDTATVNITVISAYDVWAASYGLTGSNALKSADLEPDSMDNFLEFALGGNPSTNDAAVLLPKGGIISDLGTNWLEYAFRRRSDYAARGLTYTVEATTNLVTGTWNTTGVLDAGTGTIDASFDSVTNRVSTESEPQQFMRLRVEGN